MAAAAVSKGVCAVVGCGPGMGGSVALKFAREGFAIAALNRTAKSFEPTRLELSKLGAKFAFYETDATVEASVKESFERVRKELGLVNVLVYNCGGGGFGQTVLEINPAEFTKSFEISCVGALLCTQAVLPGMLEHEGNGPHRVRRREQLSILRQPLHSEAGQRPPSFPVESTLFVPFLSP